MSVISRRWLNVLVVSALSWGALSAFSYVEGVWSRLNPNSLLEYLSFIQLYPADEQAVLARKRISDYLGSSLPSEVNLPSLALPLVNRLLSQSSDSQPLSLELIEWIEQLAQRQLQSPPSGRSCKSLDQLAKLDSKEWDMAQVAYLCSAGDQYDEEQARQLHAKVDLLALCVKFAINQGSSPAEDSAIDRSLAMIEALNTVIFQEQGFAFPALLSYEGQIDRFTSLPSLIDSKRGVCLGVSVLYLTLAKRLGLDLHIITPPGHIFLRYEGQEQDGKSFTRNIETTAYGMELPDEMYRPLQHQLLVKRSLREIPGLIFINQASVDLSHKRFSVAKKAYQRALQFLNPETSFFIRELAAYANWLSEPQRGFTSVRALWQEYRQGLAAGKQEVRVFDPLLLKEVSEGILTADIVARHFIDASDDLYSQQRRLEELLHQARTHPASQWLKLQQAMMQWRLGRVSSAWSLWPNSIALEPRLLHAKIQLALDSSHYDQALGLVERLEKALDSEDKTLMTPFYQLRLHLNEQFFGGSSSF